MPIIFIPSLLRTFTQNESQVIVQAETVGSAIDELDQLFPGIREQLLQDDRIRPTLSLVIDGKTSQKGLRQKLSQESEVHFLPQISGG
jgi:molybdopterin converting factor small subunit